MVVSFCDFARLYFAESTQVSQQFQNPRVDAPQLSPGLAMSDTNHTLPTGAAPGRQQSASGGGLFSTEDWLAVWVGLLVIVVAWALFASGSSIKWLAVAPAKWSSIGAAGADFVKHLPNYVALFLVFAVLFGVSLVALRQKVAHFLPSFLILFIASVLIFHLGAWVNAAKRS